MEEINFFPINTIGKLLETSPKTGQKNYASAREWAAQFGIPFIKAPSIMRESSGEFRANDFSEDEVIL